MDDSLLDAKLSSNFRNNFLRMRSLFAVSRNTRKQHSTEDTSEKIVIPGDRLIPVSDHLRPGFGTYELHGHIYSSLVGFMKTVPGFEGEKEITTVEVHRNIESDQKYSMPYVGCIATARVDNLGQRFAKCSIICVDNSIMLHEFAGILRKEDIRAQEKEKTEIIMCVRPGDIILCRVIGFGDNQRSFLLSTAEDRLGVVMAMGDSGERMFPSSFTEVQSSITGITESRKVARVPVLNN